MKGVWHYIARDLADGEIWMWAWLRELMDWPARYDSWKAGL